ncbi:MAG: hypothetical protein ACREA9_21030 [Pyrinomonadaceae bacterium]
MGRKYQRDTVPTMPYAHQQVEANYEAVEKLPPVVTRAATAAPNDPDDPIITMATAGRALNKHPSTIARWIKDGLLNAIRMPSGIFGLRRSELNKFLGGTSLPTKEV